MFGGLAGLVGKKNEPAKPPASTPAKGAPQAQSSTKDLLKAAAATHLTAGNTEKRPRDEVAPAQQAPAPAPKAEDEALPTKQPRQEQPPAKPAVPTPAEYAAEQQAMVTSLQAARPALLSEATAAAERVAKLDQSPAEAATHERRQLILVWLRLLRSEWESVLWAVPHEVRFSPVGQRENQEAKRRIAALEPFVVGAEVDIEEYTQQSQEADPATAKKGGEADVAYNIPAKIADNLGAFFLAVARDAPLAVEEAYLKITMGGADWHLGLFSGGNIHMRRFLDKAQKSAVRHVMNNAAVREFMLAVKILAEIAQRQKSVLGLPCIPKA